MRRGAGYRSDMSIPLASCLSAPRVFAALALAIVAAAASAQAVVTAELDASPRHHEWVDVKSGDRMVHTFVAFPERKDKALSVLVLHENRGMTDWVRLVCDRLAARGFVALAPDLLSDVDAEHRDTAAFGSGDAARKAIYALPPERVRADLLAVQAHARSLPASSGRLACVGFCWGGTQAFALAVDNQDLAVACVFYGSPPPAEQLAKVAAPVFGFYGSDDERINATIEPTQKAMLALAKSYEPVLYAGCGHAFLKHGDDPASNAAVKAGCAAAWERLTAVLGRAEVAVGGRDGKGAPAPTAEPAKAPGTAGGKD